MARVENWLGRLKVIGDVNGGSERGSVSSGEMLRVVTSSNKEKFVSCTAGGRYVTVVTTAITTNVSSPELDLKKY